MNLVIELLLIFIWTIPSYFMYRGIGQIYWYVKVQSWTKHYAMDRLLNNVTDRFRYIDLTTDLVVGFVLYGEFFKRLKTNTPFINDGVFYSFIIIFVLEKLLRYRLNGQVL